MKRLILLLAPLLGLLAGCTSPASSPVPTPYPPEYLPTVIALTSQAAAESANATFIASIPTITPTLPPLPTRTTTPGATITPTAIPEHKPGVIQLLSPGPMSKVVSPISLRMIIKIGGSEKMQVDLYGEDGRLLSRTVKKVPTSNEGLQQSVKIPFEIPAAAEVGRITVSTLDKEGRMQAMNSVHVLLLSAGENQITPTGNLAEPVEVFYPKVDEPASSGVLTVRGDIWPVNLQPVVLELVGPKGKIVGMRILAVNTINPQLFETTIPYDVIEPTVVRLTIRQDDERIPGRFYAYSQEVLLNP